MHKIRKLKPEEFPRSLLEIPDAPKELWLRGELPRPDHKILCVVGSRHFSSYGREACEKLIAGLSGFPITIVSGLALGIDGLAHEAALDAGLQTIAVPGSGLDESVLYPRSHKKLADQILAAGGGLLSEFTPDHVARPENFPQRNRIMAALSHAVLIIEARLVSGTLITSRLATDYNKDVFTVPGSMFSKTSEGPHMLLKLGATPIRTSNDIIEALGFALKKSELPDELKYEHCTDDELTALKFLTTPLSKDELLRALALPIQKVNVILSMLEIKGLIRERGGMIYLE